MRNLLIAGTMIVLFACGARAQIVSNGDMNGPIGLDQTPTSWLGYSVETVGPGGYEAQGGIFASGIPSSPSGGTFVLIADRNRQHREWISQEITGLNPGEEYHLTFFITNGGFEDTSSMHGTDIHPGSMEVSFGSESIWTEVYHHEGFGNQTWDQVTMVFYPTSSSQDLSFTAADESDEGDDNYTRLAVDGVFIEEIPVSTSVGSWSSVKALYK